VHVDVSYISMQSNLKNSSPMIFNQLSYKTMNSKWNNSLKVEFCFFEIQIWYVWLELHKNWMFIIYTTRQKMPFINYIIHNSFEWQNRGDNWKLHTMVHINLPCHSKLRKTKLHIYLPEVQNAIIFWMLGIFKISNWSRD